MLLWSLPTILKRDGPEPVSWSQLQEQWRLSSNELYSLVPLLIVAGTLAAFVLFIRSGWPQQLWRYWAGTIHALLHVIWPSGLATNDKWMLMRIARHAKLAPPSTLLISPHTFDHHAQTYLRSIQPHRDRKVQAHIDKIRGVAFGTSPSRHQPVILRFKLKHHESFTQKLTALGARHVRDLVRFTTYYNNPNHDQHPRGHAHLCLTLEQTPHHNHRHATLSWAKSNHRHDLADPNTIELPASEVGMVSKLIKDMGYTPIRRVETQHQRWAWHGCGINLDTLPYLGRFVQIDGPSERAIHMVRTRLGLDTVEPVQDSDQAMLEDYLVRHQIHDQYIPITHPVTQPTDHSSMRPLKDRVTTPA